MFPNILTVNVRYNGFGIRRILVGYSSDIGRIYDSYS